MAEVRCPAGFKPAEFECRCGCKGGLQQMDQAFLNRLEMLRTMYGSAMILTSAFRCKPYNEKIKGSKNSQHCLGKAVDVAIAESDKRHRFIACAMQLGMSVGADGAFCHVDSREGTKVFFLYPQQ